MMDGPAHYREAERALGKLEGHLLSPEAVIAFAMVHATLALAAATATGFCLDLAPSNEVRRLWEEVAP